MNIQTLKISVKSDGITSATQQINNMGNAAAKTEEKVLKLVTTVNQMAKQFSAGASGTKLLVDALNSTQKTAQASDAALKSLGAAIAVSNVATKNLSASIATLAKEISNLSNSMKQGATNVNNNTKHIVHHTKAMSDAHAAARGLTGSLGALWLTYGNVAPLAAGAAIGASLKAIVTIGADVENTLENIRIKGENSAEAMKDVAKAVTDLGQGVYGPQEVAKALETLSLAGLKAKDTVNAIGAAMNLAIVGGTDLNKAAESLVTIGTAVGATSKEFDYLADGIAKAANISLASVDSIAEAVKRASVVNKLYGATFEDILTQTAALAQLGIKNTAAGTAITNFYANALGGTEKAKKALDELGFSFQDATGKAKPLVAAYEEFVQKLNKFDLKSQQKIITDIFGERALRDVEGLRDLVNQAAESTERLADGTLKYKNRLQEVQAQIQDSAGTAALQAAQQAQTTENLFKSVANTLKSSFGEAFKAIEPDVQRIARALRDTFASQDFKTAIANIVGGFAALAKVLAENIPLITAIVEGFLAVATISAGGKIFSMMIPAVQGLAVAFGAVAVSANGAAVATGLLGTAIRLLPGIGLILGAATAAFALYSVHADKAKESTKSLAEEKAKMAAEYNTDFLKALEEESARLDKVNQGLAKGLTLQQAELATTKELALEKEKNLNKDAVAAAELALADAKKNQLRNVGDFINAPKYLKATKEAQEAVNAAKAKQVEFDTKAAKLADEIIKKTKQQQEQMEINARTAEYIALGKSGEKTFEGVDKQGNKQLSFLEEERRQLKLLAGGYEARAKAITESYLTGEKVMADSSQMRVRINKEEGKYASEAIYLQQLKLAKDADEKRNNLERIEQYVEIGQKISNILEGEKKRAELAAQGQDSGKLTAQVAAAGKLQVITEEQLKTDIARAQIADKILEANDNRNRLESATKSSLQRAEQFAAEAAIMQKYGVAVKQTAVEFAKAEIAKRGFESSSEEGKNRLSAAGLEDINKGLLELQKTLMSLEKWQEDQDAVLLESVKGVETARVESYRRTTEKAIEFEEARVQAAIDAQLAAGKITEGAADVAYAQLEARINKIRGLLGNKLTVDLKIAGLKDISTMFDRLADTASTLGKGFQGATRALDGYSKSFKTLATAEREHGKDETKMQTARIGFYGDMADASKNFFSENTAGYKALDGAAKIFHAAQLARNLVEMAQLATKAVMTQATGDPYTAWARMAAMAAVMATLGFAVGGGFSKGSGGESAADVQKAQGTGSIFGDSDAKSESISKSLDYLEKNSNLMLPLTQGMLLALRNIEASMAGLANIIAGIPGITSGTNMGIQTGKMGGNGMNLFQNTLMGTNALGGGLGGAGIGLLLGGPIGAAIGAVFGSKLGETLGKLWEIK